MDLQGRHVTHPNLHIKTAHDAHALFEAVRQGHLPMIRRRLSGGERAQLRSGDVFVWEEAAHKGGLERWTDGRKWSASRMREPFLFYEEKVARKGPYDYNSASPIPSPSLPGVPSPSPFSTNGSPSNNFQHFSHSADVGSGGLTKQTYSAWVTFPSPDGTIPDPATAYRKKWHMTAYFSSADFASLPSVQDDSLLRTIRVPHGMYETGKGLMRKAPSKESRPPPPSPVAYGDGLGRYAIPGPYVYTPGPGPHPYLPSAAPTGHGHGHLRYLNEDDRDDARNLDGDSYSYPPERERAMSTSSARADSSGGYYGAGPVPSYDSRNHQHYRNPPPRITAGRSSSSSYDQHYYEQQRHPHHAYDDRDQYREPYFSHPPRRHGSPGSPGSRSPNEDEHDEDEFDRNGEDMRSSSGISSPPPLRSHAQHSSRRLEGLNTHSASASAASSPTSASSSSSARYYGGEATGMGMPRSAARTMSMSLTLPPPPLIPNNHAGGSSGGELTPPAVLTPPISASSANGTFPHHQRYHHHSQNHHAHGEHYHHHGSPASPRREHERDRDRYYGSSQPYAQQYASAGGNSPHPYYAPAPIRTTGALGISAPASISSIRTGAGGPDQNGEGQQDYFPFVPAGPPALGRAPSSSLPITAAAKEASYPSPPPERGLGSGNGNGDGGSSGSSQADREHVPSIGALASGSGGNSGVYRSAEDRKVLDAFRVAL